MTTNRYIFCYCQSEPYHHQDVLLHCGKVIYSLNAFSHIVLIFTWTLLVILNIDVEVCQSNTILNTTEYNRVVYLNVGGELLPTTYSTLSYVPNTKLSLFDSWSRDNKGHLFLDFTPDLFKYFLHQLRRWSIRANRSLDSAFEAPSWKVKDEFNEMPIALGFQEYQQVPPVQCIEHKRVDDITRREGSGTGKLCDTNETAGWTRFVDRSGTAVNNQYPIYNYNCGGTSLGWLYGVYPSVPYSTTITAMCYVSIDGALCAVRAAQPVRVTHCGAYFVFDILVAPECALRACTTDMPMPLQSFTP